MNLNSLHISKTVAICIILGIIVIALLGVSLSRVRGVKTKADYLVAGRTLPWYILVFTLLAFRTARRWVFYETEVK